MSDIKARFVGHPDGVYLPLVPVGTEGEPRPLHIPHGGELPTEIDGHKVPASFRDSLLEQKDNWTLVNRATGDDRRRREAATTAAKTAEKEARTWPTLVSARSSGSRRRASGRRR
jgi:hypothetical protein